MYSREIYFSSKQTHRTHEDMYRYDSPFGKYKEISSSVGVAGKSAYEIAVEYGFIGTEEEWINSLKGKDGITPHIGENGNWFIGDFDTNVSAASLTDYRLLLNKPYLEGKELIDNVELDSIPDETIDSFFDGTPIIDDQGPISEEEIDELFDEADVDAEALSFEEIDELFNR